MTSDQADILDFWFGGVLEDAAGLDAAYKRWFASNPDFDGQIRSRFGVLVEQALDGGLAEWESDISSRLALIILLDQFPRNIYRRSRKAFSGDERALKLARHSIAAEDDRRLHVLERMFLYMPMQHAEDREVQRESAIMFGALAEAAEEPYRGLLQGAADYAARHRDIVLQFGRFPHRNEILGRKSAPEEQAWLESGGERFGQ